MSKVINAQEERRRYYERRDVCPEFVHRHTDALIAKRLAELDKTPQAILYFAEKQDRLSDYAYWFFLSTLWVSYTGWSELALWRELFSSDRPLRHCIMKPSEQQVFARLPETIHVVRAHRSDEVDWLSFTIDNVTAGKMALKRGVREVKRYRVAKSDVLAFFLRRGEYELLVLDKDKAEYVDTLAVEEVPE